MARPSTGNPCGFSADPVSARPCGFKPGAGAFLDESALELGERAEELQLEASHRARGVDRLGQRPHRDPAAVELEHELDQVAEAASEPVELPYDQRVTRSEAVQALIELWAVLERPGADVLEDPLDAGAAERVELQRTEGSCLPR